MNKFIKIKNMLFNVDNINYISFEPKYEELKVYDINIMISANKKNYRRVIKFNNINELLSFFNTLENKYPELMQIIAGIYFNLNNIVNLRVRNDTTEDYFDDEFKELSVLEILWKNPDLPSNFCFYELLSDDIINQLLIYLENNSNK